MKIQKKTTARGYPYLRVTDMKVERSRALASARLRLPYVHDTWLNRTKEARLANLEIGYIAQEILEAVFRKAGIPLLTYDATRIDKSRNNDPFDFLLFPPGFKDLTTWIEWLKKDIYPAVNSQGRIRLSERELLQRRLVEAGAYIADLKSSVDNHRHGIDEIIAKQHHIAYATQKNDAGFHVVSGREYLAGRGETFEEYAKRKPAIKDVHFRVFFESTDLDVGYYVGFILGKELILDGEVGPFPGTPWVLYHRQIIEGAYPPGAERRVLFASQDAARAAEEAPKYRTRPSK